MIYYLVFSVAIICNAFANILIKEGMKRVEDVSKLHFVDVFVKIVSNIWVISGVLLFGVALFAYSYVLNNTNLSKAYPIMTSVGYVIVIAFTTLVAGEKFSVLQFVGIALITGGVWLVTK